MENFKKVLLLTFLFHAIWLLTMISLKTNEIIYLVNQVGSLLFVVYYLTSVVIVSLLSLLFIKILK